MRRVVAVVIALCAAACYAEDQVYPSPGQALGMIRTDTPSSWMHIAQQQQMPIQIMEFDGDEEVGYKSCFFEGPAGTYTIVQVWSEGKRFRLKQHVVTLGGVAPGPNPPPGPGPQPGPTTDLFPDSTGLHMLILYEQDDRAKMPFDQWAALTSQNLPALVESKSPGKWRIYDEDRDFSGDVSWVDVAAKRAKSTEGYKTPWILIGNDKTGYEGPLPANIVDIVKLIEEYSK